MDTRDDRLGAVRAYLRLFPDDQPHLARLAGQMSAQEDLFSRQNFTGHLTASALVLNGSGTRVLLIEHLGLGRLLQPGGHVDAEDESLWEAARRELAEETGVTAAHLSPWHERNGFAPVHIDSHPIPARPDKNVPDHFHHDCLFLFTVDDSLPLVPQMEEVSAAEWRDVSDPVIAGRSLDHAIRRARTLSLIP